MVDSWNLLETSSSLIISIAWADITQRLDLLTGTPTGVLASSQYGGLRVITLGICQLKYFNKQGGRCIAFYDPSSGHTVFIPAHSIGQSNHNPVHIQEERN